MKAGFSQFDVTPLEGFMPGEGLPFWARGEARCPLYANAVALGGKETVILISVDALSFFKDRTDDLRARISAATGVPVANIMIAATHTHTGASGYEPNSGAPGEPLVAKYTDDGIVKVAVEAFQTMTEGFSIGSAKGTENRMSFNRDCILDDGTIRSIPGKANKDRIVGYLGEVDYDVHVMRVQGADGKPAAFIVNYANHPDNDNTKRYHFSADFPGFLRQNLQATYGEDTVVVFYADHYNYYMMAMYASSYGNSSTGTSTMELDKDRYYYGVLNGPESAGAKPQLKLTFSAPKTAE